MRFQPPYHAWRGEFDFTVVLPGQCACERDGRGNERDTVCTYSLCAGHRCASGECLFVCMCSFPRCTGSLLFLPFIQSPSLSQAQGSPYEKRPLLEPPGGGRYTDTHTQKHRLVSKFRLRQTCFKKHSGVTDSYSNKRYGPEYAAVSHILNNYSWNLKYSHS